MNELEQDIRNYIDSIEEEIKHIPGYVSKYHPPIPKQGEDFFYLQGKLKTAKDILERIESQTALEYLKQSQIIMN
jgi:hypothetical protein